ncbi:SPL family radical SAM protein [Solemya velum gill symbiont]|uniref:SPL family radical SAM protein n=1 Tax=Solemya velum gill symbiont TaxID=2340 RepID=UPI0009963213|nr:DNA photolyase [Solemya velum gill symbiont]OOY36884.1 DNA photolyase [Solemya velum gill symbiont]OOY40046.1 DNA photolyase [Solemya velum gill symbiont]OOY44940.1 DNA photolyase [Solemya velum gill symbiont]OOY46491.1 DNA photolyase [Solemya velum gill symbiont]OOY50103.1 DNA photolyase [Solemya velum gill symbiont]
MIPLVYVEESVRNHPRTESILARHPRASVVPIERYGSIFNHSQQNFRLQKQRPALILANKHGHFVQPAPDAYGVGGNHNWYFSHMLNCLYDCRYCFLQGMYRSAHYLVFVNFESFLDDIDSKIETGKQNWFFSGYDADSLALEPVTGFVANALPFFATRPDAWLELRTKSTQVRQLLEHDPLSNVVTAFSYTPEATWKATEHKVPSIEKRIQAMKKLAENGWIVALRFDPLIEQAGFNDAYSALFEQIFSQVPESMIHSATIGPLRMPKQFHRTMENLYPEESLFVSGLAQRNSMVSYPAEREREMIEWATDELEKHLPGNKIFPNLPS